jgi:muconolactone delta-isomerase
VGGDSNHYHIQPHGRTMDTAVDSSKQDPCREGFCHSPIHAVTAGEQHSTGRWWSWWRVGLSHLNFSLFDLHRHTTLHLRRRPQPRDSLHQRNGRSQSQSGGKSKSKTNLDKDNDKDHSKGQARAYANLRPSNSTRTRTVHRNSLTNSQ